MGDEGLPVTWQLGVVLVWFFALFNQLLFTGMKAFSLVRGEVDTAAKFGVTALVIGSIVLFWNLCLFSSAKSKQLVDFLVVGGAALLSGVFLLGLVSVWEDSSSLGLLGANLVISLWLARGLLRLKTSKKQENE